MINGDRSWDERAKPKFTESVMVQLPMSQINPVMKESTVLFDLAIWKD
jgi:hypothetical protein